MSAAAQLPQLPGEATVNARAAILTAWLDFHRGAGLSVYASMTRFAELYSTGAIEVAPAEVRAEYPDVSRGTLARWYEAQQAGGVAALKPAYGNRLGQGIIDRQPEIRDCVIGELVTRPHVRASQVMQALVARFGRGRRPDLELPCDRTLRGWIAEYRAQHAATLLSIANPDAWKSKYMVALGDAAGGVVRLNQRWELDSSPADVMLEDGRHCLIGVIDVYSRRLRHLVAKTSRSTAIGLLLRRALLDWGTPEQAVTDQGQDYVSVYLTRVLLDLGIEQKLCTKFSPEQKPFIERSFRTLAHDLVELLPGYVGHNVVDRKAIESRKSFAQRLCERDGAPVELPLTAAKLQEFCDTWDNDLYARRPHEGLNGRTPFEVAAAWREPVRRVTDARALDLLLAEPADGGVRVVQKKGVRVEGAWFGAVDQPEVGTEVRVKLDPTDIGRVMLYSTANGTFLCVAQNLDRLGAMPRAELALRAKQHQRQQTNARRREAKILAQAAGSAHTVELILEDARREAAKLVALPGPSTAHETPALAAAAAAADAREQEQARRAAAPVAVQVVNEPANVVGADELARRRALQVPAAPPRTRREDCETEWALALWCAEELADGRALEAEDASWWTAWRRRYPERAAGVDEVIEQRFGRCAAR
jgi:transposase InsO family protein